MTGARGYRIISLVAIAYLSLSPIAYGQEARTVIGPSNVDLADGADALLAGDAEEGVRLTLAGLRYAKGARERHTAWSNLCAGYVMLEDYAAALGYCDRVLDENDQHWRAYSNRALTYIKLKRYEEAQHDLERAETLAPNSRTVKAVRAMLLDAIQPVAPSIVIDDRRQPAEDENHE